MRYGDGPVKRNPADSWKKFQRNNDCRDCTMSVDKMIEESMRNISRGLTERNLLTLFKQFDGRDKIDDLKKLITKLECMIEKGQGNVCIRAMVRSKRKELNQRLCGTPSSTPPESEDEDGGELLEQCGVEDIFCENMVNTSAVPEQQNIHTFSAKSDIKLGNTKVTQENLRESETLVCSSITGTKWDHSNFRNVDSQQHFNFEQNYMNNA